MVGTTVKLFQKPKLKKLNNTGVGHHALIAVIVISAFAGLGAYRVFMTSAATSTYSIGLRETKTSNGAAVTGCWLAGRVWDDKAAAGEKCQDKCRVNGTELVPRDAAKDRPAYCKGHITLASDKNTQEACVNQLHRWWVASLGCARKHNQENANEAKRFCPNPKHPNYVAQNNVDKCVTATIVDIGDGTKNPPTDQMSQEQCNLLGRQPADATRCKRVCVENGGALLSQNNVIYCQRAVALEITEERCKQLHRKWLGAGCARLIGQKDTLNAKQCVSGYPYYNANFQPKTGDPTLIDVCEKDKTTADLNEQNGLLGGVQLSNNKNGENPPRTDDCGAANAPARCSPQNNNDNNADFKIVLFKDKDFKGDKLEASAKLGEDGETWTMTFRQNDKKLDVKDLMTMPKGWNDKVSSYKILKGRWKLCPDENYAGGNKSKCVKPYASDPNLADVKDKKKSIDNEISSVTISTHTEAGDTIEELELVCLDKNGAPIAMVEGECPKGTTPTCVGMATDGVIIEDGECKEAVVVPDMIVPVDKDFKGKEGERNCLLLGRQWIAKPKSKDINGGEYGCSIVTCDNEKDGRPRNIVTTGSNDNDKQKSADTVCVSYRYDAPYAVKLDKEVKESKKKCNERHRVWIQQVRLCAQVPNRKDKNQTIVDSERCASKGRDTYYIYKETSKTDECFTPSYFDRAKSVAKSTRGALGAALREGPKAYCNTVKRGNYHWDGKKCVIDRHKCWNGNSIPVTQKCPPKPAPTPNDPYSPDPYSPDPTNPGNNNGGGNGNNNNDNGNNLPHCDYGSYDPTSGGCPGHGAGLGSRTEKISCSSYVPKTSRHDSCTINYAGDPCLRHRTLRGYSGTAIKIGDTTYWTDYVYICA